MMVCIPKVGIRLFPVLAIGLAFVSLLPFQNCTQQNGFEDTESQSSVASGAPPNPNLSGFEPVYLQPKLSQQISASQLNGMRVPVTPSSVLSLNPLETSGIVGSIPAGSTFGANSSTGTKALALAMPQASVQSSILKGAASLPLSVEPRGVRIQIPVPELTVQRRGESFWFHALVGLRGAHQRNQVSLALTASGWEFGSEPSEGSVGRVPKRKTLGLETLYPGASYPIWIPIGTWALKPGAQFTLEISDIGSSSLGSALVVLDQAQLFSSGNRPILSIS